MELATGNVKKGIITLSKSEMHYAQEKLREVEMRLSAKYATSMRTLDTEVEKVLERAQAVEDTLKEWEKKFFEIRDIVPVAEESFDRIDGSSGVVKEGLKNHPEGTEKETEESGVFRGRCVLRSQDFVKGKPAGILVLQGMFTLRHRGEEVPVRIGISWPEPIYLVVCFPYREDQEENYFGDFHLTLRFLDHLENVCVERRAYFEAYNGSCQFSASATNLEHLDCEDPTHEDELFESDDQKRKLETCFTLHDAEKDKCFYSVQLDVECLPSLEINNEAETETKYIPGEVSSRVSPRETTVEQEVVPETIVKQEQVSQAVVKQEVITQAVINSQIILETAVKKEVVRMEPVDNRPAGRTPCEKFLERGVPIANNCSVPKTAVEVNHPLIAKLTPNGSAAFQSWVLRSDTRFWSDDIPINLELLHFGHRVQIPELVNHVLKNLRSVEDNKFTLEFACDVLAAAYMYKAEMPELQRRIAHFIL